MSDDGPEEQAPQTEAPAKPVASAPSASPATTEARRRRRKKRRADAGSDAEPARAVEPEPDLDPDLDPAPFDDGVPTFARGFPREPALDALVAAFEAGAYARVRREAPALARQTDDDAVRAAARELRRRLDPDPLSVYLLGAAALLLVFLAGWYWAHPHTP